MILPPLVERMVTRTGLQNKAKQQIAFLDKNQLAS